MTLSKISTSNPVNGQNSVHWWHHRLDSSSRRLCRKRNWVTRIVLDPPYPKSTEWQCRRPTWFPCWKSPPQSWAWRTLGTCCAQTFGWDWFCPRRSPLWRPPLQSACGFAMLPTALEWTGWLPWTVASLLTYLALSLCLYLMMMILTAVKIYHYFLLSTQIIQKL